MPYSLKTKAQKAIKSLGTRWTDVRKKLVEDKCSGQKLTATSCPVANFMQKKLGNDKRVERIFVDGVDCAIFQDAVHHIDIKLPGAVKTFIRKFDNNEIPELHVGK